MERKRIITITIVCVLFCTHQKIFGTEVEIRVKTRGDNVTFFCDRAILAFEIVWIKNQSHGNQSTLYITAEALFLYTFPRFTFLPNSSGNSYDLHIANVSIYDEGIYFCAKAEKNLKEVNGKLESRMEYQYGNRKTHLMLVSKPAPTEGPPKTDPSNNMILWMLLGSVCPVCLILCFICICCLCQQKKNTGSGVETQARNRHEEENDVYYASLHHASIQKQPRRSPRSDFSTYSEVRFKRT
ncbi:hypothetical protein E1301_Tti007074 [Triplophysa tibetana]|uniref:Ig-like domain-containing protein n=1 Tax=Triplophysa tibetana TaxID=1572043 RepID=A0A5A9PK18_9TELE|nr:hypothetical protein E1301_Tti007074 [Triplophysa tibetana]